MKDGHSLRLASHDSGKCSSRSNVISSAQYGGAVNPGVAVRGVGRVQLIAAVDPGEPVVFLDGNINGKGEITRYAEDVPDSERRQSLHNVVDHGWIAVG